MSSDVVEVEGAVSRKTDEAMLFTDGVREVWLPLSQLSYDHTVEAGDLVVLEMPEWLAYEKRLI